MINRRITFDDNGEIKEALVLDKTFDCEMENISNSGSPFDWEFRPVQVTKYLVRVDGGEVKSIHPDSIKSAV